MGNFRNSILGLAALSLGLGLAACGGSDLAPAVKAPSAKVKNDVASTVDTDPSKPGKDILTNPRDVTVQLPGNVYGPAFFKTLAARGGVYVAASTQQQKCLGGPDLMGGHIVRQYPQPREIIKPDGTKIFGSTELIPVERYEVIHDPASGCVSIKELDKKALDNSYDEHKEQF